MHPHSANAITINIPSEVATRLKKFSVSTECSEITLIAEAIEEYLDLHEWQVQAIQNGLTAVEKGELVDFDKVKKYWENKFANSAH